MFALVFPPGIIAGKKKMKKYYSPLSSYKIEKFIKTGFVPGSTMEIIQPNKTIGDTLVEAISVPYADELSTIKYYLKNQEPFFEAYRKRATNFSRERGAFASLLAQKNISDLQVVTGHISLPRAGGNHLHCCHTWNWDEQRRLYVDLMFDQFQDSPSGTVYFCPVNFKNQEIYRPLDSERQTIEIERKIEELGMSLEVLVRGYCTYKARRIN
jgi:hypothetical protein